ncbi:hypothetical protein [Mycolicibacterium sp. XJ870]
MNDKELRDLMDAEAEEAANAPDEDDGASLPAHVNVSRPGRARSRVLQVRLNPDEFEAIERIAARRGLPASTVARDWLLRMIREDEAQAGEMDVTTLLHHLEATVAQLRHARTAECRR